MFECRLNNDVDKNMKLFWSWVL